MKYDNLHYTLDNHPSIKVLKLKTAALIISFLYNQFKKTHKMTITQPELVENLEDYLQRIHEEQPELYTRSAAEYIDIWCNEHKLMRRFYEENSNTPVFELTPAAEKSIGWLEDILRTEFIGTESRFLRVFDLLNELTIQSIEDPEYQVEQLEKQKAIIQQKIDTITRTGQVEQYSSAQIRERFFEANEITRSLLADFRQVEQNFREITRRIQSEQLTTGMRKGDVVANVLDADAELKESPQGCSFYAFWSFLQMPDKQNELQANLEKVYNLPDIQPVGSDYPTLRQIKRSLLEAGTKIIQSNYRLAEQLRRLLDKQYLAESRRITELSQHIKKLALMVENNLFEEAEFICIEGDPNIQLPLERPLWELPVIPNFNSYELDIAKADLTQANLTNLYSRIHVDKTKLQRQINTMLTRYIEISLGKLTKDYPIQQGLPEIITYLVLASQNEKYQINDQIQEQIVMFDSKADGQTRQVTVPQIIFRQ